jgi:hypothetical protein
MLQAEAKDAIGGRVMDFYAAIIGLAGLFGNLALGPLADVLTARAVLAACLGALLPGSVVALAALIHRRGRQGDTAT